MRNILLCFISLMVMANTSWATVGWRISIPATSENPQAISPDVIENNTALDLMLQNYRDGGVYVKLISTSEIDIGPGGVMLSNSGGSTRLMVANASLTAMSSTNIDTGSISPSSTYYIYAYASSTTATTFSVIYSASSTSPTGITYYAKLGSFTTDGSSNFLSATNSLNPQVGLGSWTSESVNTVYQASTDGFVLAWGDGTGATDPGIIGYTDSSPSPTTVRISWGVGSGGGSTAEITMPVRKGDYWKVTSNALGSTQIYWISLGT